MQSIVKNVINEVAAGSRAVLKCNSNDDDHFFKYWILNSNQVVGPNNDYDERKYKVEVLSGTLRIDKVSPEDAGTYRCISQRLGLKSGEQHHEISVAPVDVVTGGYEFDAMEGVKLVAIVVSIIVIISCAVFYFRLRKEWNKYDGRIVVPVDDQEEEEDEGDEIYRTTTTLPTQHAVAGPSKAPSRNQSSEHLLYGIDNHGLDTDFNSVFENIQIKSPPSLI